MRALGGVCTCVAVVVLGGCGGDGSTSKAKTAASTTATRPGDNAALAKNLGKATPSQRRRARAYTTCLVRHVKKIRLTFREGTDQTPPEIIGAIRGTRFGINLGRSPADGKRLERMLRTLRNNALYRRGSTVVAFAGSNPSSADITILTNCADRVG